MIQNELIAILDFGGQNNQLAARKVRDMQVYCEVKPYTIPLEELKQMHPKGIIIIGTAGAVPEQEAGKYGKGIAELQIPMLLIGYDAKWIGTGKRMISPSFLEEDMKILRHFLFDVCGLRGDWTTASFIEHTVQDIREKVSDGKVLCALSGGVDSSVSAVLLAKAVGKQLTCIFVDHGLMRKNEADEVEAVFGQGGRFDLNFIRIDARQRFYDKLSGTSEPEQKRKIIGEEFIRVFEEEAKKIGTVDFLVQGTIYPDVIESGIGSAAVIKSHHNVGGLPDYVDFKEIIEPLRLLFKDEVRRVGTALGIPEKLVQRQPFPGPGLAVRIVGEVTAEKVKIVQEADAVFREEMELAGLSGRASQFFAALTNLRSVGMKNNVRTYDYAVVLRAVHTVDFMTADAVEIPWEVLWKVTKRIVDEVEHVNRVFYDCTGKPPGTIELE